MSYQMVKLSNGEDIICNVEDENGHILIISSPLKMETYNRTTEKGMIESLGLSRWIQLTLMKMSLRFIKIQSC